MYPVKQSTSLPIAFFAHDVNGDGVTGKVDGDWTKRISKAGGAFAAMTVTISEMENGWYSLTLSTAHTDTLGILSLSFSASGVKRVNLQYRVTAREMDDLAFPTVSGRSIDVTSTGEVGVDLDNTVGTLGSSEIPNLDAAVSSRLAASAAPANFGALVITAGGIVDADVETVRGSVINTLVSGRVDSEVGAYASGMEPVRPSVVGGVADSGTTTTMVDAARTEGDTDYWKGCFIQFRSGSLNGQVRLITAFDPATDTITFAPATTQAVSTHTYDIIPHGRVDLHFWLGVLANALISGRVDANVQAMAAGVIGNTTFAAGAIDAAAIAANAIGASELASDAVTEIVNGVWDEPVASHVSAGSTGERVERLDIVASGGSGGLTNARAVNLDNLDAAVSSRASSAALSTVQSDTDDIQSRLPAALVGGRMDASVGAYAAGLAPVKPSASGTADSGTTTTMVDAARTEADVDYWKGCLIQFTSGTLAGQTRLITAFDPTTDTVTFAPATTVAVGTHTYDIVPFGRVDVHSVLGALINALISGRIDANTQAMATAVIDATKFAVGALDAAAAAASLGQEIADEVLNRDLAGGASGGSRGVRNALRALRNRVNISGGTATVYEEDDTTAAWTATITTAAGDPITQVDPA